MAKRKKNQKREENQRETKWYSISDISAEEIFCAGYKSFRNNSDIRTAVHKIADLVSSMSIHLMQNTDNGDIRLKNELAKKIDTNPNKLMTRKNFIYNIVTTAILDGGGNCVIYPKYDTNGYLDDLIFFDMGKVTYDCVSSDYKIKYAGQTFDADELIHIVVNPKNNNPFVGQGFTKELVDIAKSLAQSEATKKGFLRSKWKPSLIILAQGLPDSLSNKEGREKILNQYLETSEAGQPWILPADSFEVKEIKPLTLKDLALIETLELDKKSIANLLGVPSFFLGVGDFNKDEYNNFISSIILPWAQNIVQEFTKKLLYSSDLYFKFNPRSLYQYDLQHLAIVGEKLVKLGAMNRNELRDWFGMTPKEGLDEILMLENYLPVDKLAEQKKLKEGK